MGFYFNILISLIFFCTIALFFREKLWGGKISAIELKLNALEKEIRTGTTLFPSNLESMLSSSQQSSFVESLDSSADEFDIKSPSGFNESPSAKQNSPDLLDFVGLSMISFHFILILLEVNFVHKDAMAGDRKVSMYIFRRLPMSSSVFFALLLIISSFYCVCSIVFPLSETLDYHAAAMLCLKSMVLFYATCPLAIAVQNAYFLFNRMPSLGAIPLDDFLKQNNGTGGLPCENSISIVNSKLDTLKSLAYTQAQKESSAQSPIDKNKTSSEADAMPLSSAVNSNIERVEGSLREVRIDERVNRDSESDFPVLSLVTGF